MSRAEILVEAAKSGDVATVRRLVGETPALASARLPSGESPLIAALYRGHRPVVEALIESGAELDVFAAAATGRLPALRAGLQTAGAIGAYSYDGWTPLHLAAFFGQREAVRALLDAGADVRSVSRNSLGNTPLHAATAGKHADAALLLLHAGADPDVLDAGGHSPRRIATENGLDAVVAAMKPAAN